MKKLINGVLSWMTKLNVILRCFVFALLFHIGILSLLAVVKVGEGVVEIIKIKFEQVDISQNLISTEKPDINAIIRDFDYDPPGVKGNELEPSTDRYISKTSDQIKKSEGSDSYSDFIGVLDNSTIGKSIGTGIGGLITSAFQTGGNVGGGSINGTSYIGVTGGTGKGPWDNRFGKNKVINARKYKQTEDAEKSILAGLRWLKANQKSDGSWVEGKISAQKDALTALAILSYFGHGHTQDDKEFGETINRGIIYLLNTIDSNGIVESKNMYAQGAVMLCISEIYGITKVNIFKNPLERMVNASVMSQRILKNESNIGGWKYTTTAGDSDLSVSGWMVMGLKSARLAGIEVPADSFDNATKYIWNCYSDGGFSYQSGGSKTPNMTSVGVLCQQFLGHGNDNRIKKSLDYLKLHKFNYNEGKGHSLYGWYYTTQAMFQGSGGYWEYWNKEFQRNLIDAQQLDGRWDPPSGETQYGPVYSTTLSCLMLEVYYRYTPMYMEMEKSIVNIKKMN